MTTNVTAGRSTTDQQLSALYQWAQQSPLSSALITTNTQYNWQQLAQLVGSCVTQLVEQGVGAGSVVTVVGKNQTETVFIYLACLEIGAICALTMPQPKAKFQGKLDTLYAPLQTRFVWFSDSALLDKSVSADASASENARDQDHQCLTLSFSLTEKQAVLDLSDSAISNSDFGSSSTNYDTDNIASIIFTSGSTGEPKAVAHTSSQHFASASGLLERFSFLCGDTWLLSLPMFHVSGLAIIYRWLSVGACLKVGLGNILDDVNGVTHASLVATQLKRLLESKRPLTLTHALLGGSHIPKALGGEAALAGVETWLGYGMTEAASTVTAKRVNALGNESDSAGSVLPNRKVKLVGQKIYVGGQTLASGYFHQGKVTSFLDSQGWFDSRDLGEWQNEQLNIIGRADNQFTSGGENIHCEEIELVLNRHLNVTQAFVIPIEDKEYGHRPVAIIQANIALNKTDFDDYLNGKLEKFKWPTQYYVLPESILETGIKVSRQQLKLWLATMFG